MGDKNGDRGDRRSSAGSEIKDHPHEHKERRDNGKGDRKFDIELVNCTGDCAPDTFPDCEGTCSAELEGRNATRPERPLSNCSGDCTPENFPWCEGSCITTLNSTDLPHGRKRGHGKGNRGKGDKHEMKERVFNSSELVDCTGDCTPESFPDCEGTCDKQLLGRNETRPGPVLSDCTGDCTPDNFPWCEGTCVGLFDSSDGFGPRHREEDDD